MPRATKPLNKKSLRLKEKRETAIELYCDGDGVPFKKAAKWLVGNPIAWPEMVFPREQLDVRDSYREQFAICFVCGHERFPFRPLSIHHIAGSSLGRIDCFTNYMMLCDGPGGCHPQYQSDKKNFPFLLYRKWLVDRANLSWPILERIYLSHFTFDLMTEPTG